MHNDKDFQRNFTLKWGVEDNCYKDKIWMSFLRKMYGDQDQNQKISLVIMKDKMLYQLIGTQTSKTVEDNCYKDKIWMPFLSKVYGDRDQNQKISLVIMKGMQDVVPAY